jgi:hypothetical protein
LLAEIAHLESDDSAADWANKNFPAKNTLIDHDAKIVEQRFRERLATIDWSATESLTETRF